tara:strand:+ start:1738 stop:1959 length:222 start_codon:yes stop_codon:yes gene_type:complete
MTWGVEYEKMIVFTPDRNGEMREVPIEVVQWINKNRFKIAREELLEKRAREEEEAAYQEELQRIARIMKGEEE